MSEWKKPEDELPSYDEIVIGYWGPGITKTCMEFCRYRDGRWCDIESPYDDEIDFPEPTLWMKRPELP